jgi:AraC family transcriptional regulator
VVVAVKNFYLIVRLAKTLLFVATLTACHSTVHITNTHHLETRKPPMQSVRIIEIPDCKMVSSGRGMFGEEKFDGFAAWFSSLPRTLYSMDFLSFSYDEKGEFNGMVWYYVYDGVNAPDGYDIVEFKGGLYAVTTDIDQRTDIAVMDTAIHEFLATNHLEQDLSRPRLGHIISTPSAQKALGYNQMDYFMPVKPHSIKTP